MFQFNFQKIAQVPRDFFKPIRETNNYLEKLREVLKTKNYDLPESFLIFPEEKFEFQKIELNFKLIILVGIGGASQGAQAIYAALKNKKKLKEILFLDTLNPILLREIISKVKLINQKKEKTAICLISKSGLTIESIINFFTFWQAIKKYLPKVFIITEENSPLWNFGQKKNWQLFSVPKQIEDRYSIFGKTGIFPLYLSGVNIKELFLGAKMANERCLVDDLFKNFALASALTIFYHWKRGKNNYVNFVFPPELDFFGKWYSQLMAESLGEDNKGITPMTAIGTNDLHSLAQLFFDGPQDKLFNFVFIENLGLDFSISELKDFAKIFPGTKNKKIWQLTKVIFEGVKRVYLKKKIPFTETILPELNERNLGFLFEMKMIEIILLAKLMKVCPFDQPAVKLYKKETQKFLKNSSQKN